MNKAFGFFRLVISAPFRFIAQLPRRILNQFRRVSQSVHKFFTEEEEDTPTAEALGKAFENPSALFEHLDVLRKHLLRSLLVVIITTSFSFIFVSYILDFLAMPLDGGINSLQAIDVTENIGTVMRVSLLSGFAIALPYVVWEIWLFIAPGLKARSRVRGMLTIPAATLLFVLGMAFAFYVMLPVALPFLFNFMGLSTVPRPSSYYNFVTGVMFWIGLSFEFPLVIYILAGLGVIKAKMLVEQWRLAIVLIAVISAVITPTVDPVNMALVMGPMIVLYIISIVLAYLAQR
jgi:sec-independent protein translocase protein TatC